MNVLLVPLYASPSHDPLPVRGTVKRESDEAPLAPPFKLADYPVLADCTGCTVAIRKPTQLRDAWEHAG
jgi:hypothetical protein